MNTTMHSKSNNKNSTSNLNISILTDSSVGQASANSPGSGSTTITDRIEWSRATILDFIEDYRRQRVLWDPNTKGYHIKQTKYEALKSLGSKYGAEIRSIRSKIKSLRSSFHREHGKVLNSRRKGLNYQPMWFAYDAIRFILDGEAGDSDEAETKNDLSIKRETTLMEPNNNQHHHRPLNLDEELMEERKISSRDIEHFNNHFLALGLQARHPMAVIAAVEAAAAATAAQERRQEQENALRQQQQLNAATQLKLLELTTNIAANSNKTNTNTSIVTSVSSSSCSTANQFNPISKSINSPKPTSPLPLALSVSTPLAAAAATATTTMTATSSVTITATPPPPLPSSTTTCSSDSINVLHGSRSLDENSALAAATALPSLSITAVTRNSDFDSNEYCNISADDVKTEIFENDSNELAMLESTRTSTPVPLNYHKNATDLTTNRSNTTTTFSGSNANMSSSIVAINDGNSSRKRKAQKHSNVNVNNNNEDAPSPSKLHQRQIHQQQKQQQQQHSNAIHSRQCDYSYSNNRSIMGNNVNTNQSHTDNSVSNAIIIDNHEEENGDTDDDDEIGYSTSFSHLQTTLINACNNNNNTSNPLNSQNFKINNNNGNSTPIDEYGVFGEYVAITIRKLKTSKAKIVVKHLINNLLYEAEMGKYDQGISSSKEPPELYKM